RSRGARAAENALALVRGARARRQRHGARFVAFVRGRLGVLAGAVSGLTAEKQLYRAEELVIGLLCRFAEALGRSMHQATRERRSQELNHFARVAAGCEHALSLRHGVGPHRVGVLTDLSYERRDIECLELLLECCNLGQDELIGVASRLA